MHETTSHQVVKGGVEAEALLHALRSAMEHLMAAPGSALGTEHALTRWGEVSGVERLYYFEITDGTTPYQTVARLCHEWVSPPSFALGTAFQMRWDPATAEWQSALARNERLVLSLPSVPADARVFWADSVALSALLVPVFLRGTFRGFMGCDDFRSEHFWGGFEEAALYSLGAAIASSRMVAHAAKLATAWAAEMDRMTEGMMRAVTPMYERCDPYVVGHQQRVSDLATEIGKRMGLSGRRLSGIRIGSLVHDIGRPLVPSAIFQKTDPLSANEISEIRSHAAAGHEILKTLDCPWPVAVMALQHHERMDGSGYPAGLHGNQISMEARVLAVADVVEAMCAPRPHRPAVCLADAVDAVCQGSHTLYDGAAVSACREAVVAGAFRFNNI